MSAQPYSVTINSTDKVIISYASGFIKMEDAKEIISQFKAAIQKVNTKEYALIVDGKDAKTVSTDVVPLMQEVLELYAGTPFKAKYMIELNAGIQANQVKRVGGENANELVPIGSVEEAIASFKQL
ncbi:hypothetical protein [Gorillibacterium timonense]|uniref:hypothetical protein n=1 Tax=Gorillibacterium timonense TaxID=1689269 RepID=UPI00071D48BF|nr:hypothetical protein [Gorillibacterium timonense]